MPAAFGNESRRRAASGGRQAQQPEPKRGGVASMQSTMSGLLRSLKLDRKLAGQDVLQAWNRAASDGSSNEVGTRARAVRFDAGELTVEVASAALLAELTSFTGESLRASANRLLGSERIQRVSFQPKRTQ